MLKVPKGTPKISVIAETATIRTKWRIWKTKTIMVKRLQQQDMSSLAKKVYKQQLALGWPGLAREVSEICNVNLNMVKKEKVHKMIFYHDYKDLKDEMYSSKKMEDVKPKVFRTVQHYMEDKSIEQSWLIFRIRTQMMKNFKDNYQIKY